MGATGQGVCWQRNLGLLPLFPDWFPCAGFPCPLRLGSLEPLGAQAAAQAGVRGRLEKEGGDKHHDTHRYWSGLILLRGVATDNSSVRGLGLDTTNVVGAHRLLGHDSARPGGRLSVTY